jgi:hypothetical protein
LQASSGFNDQRPVRLADKPWLKVLLADLLREKNIVPWLISSSWSFDRFNDL